MPYISLTDYVDQFGEAEAIRLTDETGTADSPDPDAYAKAAAQADADVDAYLAGRYTLPLSETPPLVKSIAAALTREKLHATFPTDAVTRQADLARRQLGDLATGKAVLILADATEPEERSGGGSGISWTAPVRVFSREALERY